MLSVLEDLLVALLVAGSVMFSAWRLLSARLRLSLLDIAQPWLAGPALRNLSGRWLARLREGVLEQLAAGGCGSCSHHKTPVKPAPAGVERQ